MIGNKTKRSKNTTNSRMKSLFPKTLFRHKNGIPPSATRGNRFNAVVHNKNLLYIANSNIVYIDLTNKKFAQIFTSNLLSQKEKPNVIFVLLGGQPQSFTPYIAKHGCTIVKAPHPAYYVRVGEDHYPDKDNPFLQIDNILKERGEKPIIWAE